MPRPQQHALPALILALVACHEPPAPDAFRVTVSVRTAGGDPVPGAEISQDRAVVGATGAGGQLVLDVTASEGDELRLAARCPGTYLSPERPTTLLLRRVVALDDASPSPLEVSFACRPRSRVAAVVIRASGQADLPVRLHGTELARTDQHGVAHLVVSAAPHSTLALALDTTGRPLLRPQNPALTVRLEDADELFVLEQAFEVEQPPAPPPPPRRRRARKPAPPPRPEKIVPRAARR